MADDKNIEAAEALIIEENKRLVERYPFLSPLDDNGNIPADYDYTWTYLDDMPEGWKKTFGELLCEDIREELLRCNFLSEYRVFQVKEKFGELRWYDNGTPEGCEVHDIIDRYACISGHICISCGALDAHMVYGGWISPYCEKCYSRFYKNSDVAYEKATEGETDPIPTKMRWRTWAEEGIVDMEEDISETVQKIRARYGNEQS